MNQFLLICLILADVLVVLTMAEPALSPSNSRRSDTAEAPVIRRLGKHQPKVLSYSVPPASSPSFGRQEPEIAESPVTEQHEKNSVKEVTSSEHPVSKEPEKEESAIAGASSSQRVRKHHSSDKSMAGGGVILGGFATTFLVSIFCYIRATRRRNGDSTSY